MSCQCNQPQGACATEFQYAVKVVCGEVVSVDNVPTPVAPGQYRTAVNIHNFSKCRDAQFRWKVAVANPGKPGPVSAYSRPLTLRPDEALEIDCPQVMRALAQPPPRFVKGYVVIEGDELDVVAVYSGTTGPCGSNTFCIERVPGRCVPVCEDLALSLNTGVAPWETVSPTAGPAVPVAGPLPNTWGAPPFGSVWLSQTSGDAQNVPPGTRSYQFCFDLCTGFTPPARFPIQVLADNSALVYLNGSPIGSVPGYTTPTTLTVNPGFLRAGRNCFRVDVTNNSNPPPEPPNNPTGFALAGMLQVARGKCPCSQSPVAARPTGPAGIRDESLEPPTNG
jgi:hypothetical protein